jgi:hypothetical protein
VSAGDGDTPRAIEPGDHDDEFDDAPPAPRDGRYTWLPVAAAAVLAGALVLVAILLNLGNSNADPSYGKRVDTHGALLCPKTYRQVTDAHPRVWVPVKPNQISARKRLTSTKKPTNAVVCGYLTGSTLAPTRLARATVPLTARHVLAKKAAQTLNTTFGAVPAGAPSTVCADNIAVTDGDDYLVGFTYDSGTLWVSTPGNHCKGASNGSFRTVTNLRSVAAAAYRAGS